MNEIIDMRGCATLQITDREGRLLYEQHYPNRIVTTGRDLVARLFAGSSGGTPPGPVTHMAIGTNRTPAADDQTGLLAERTRKLIQPEDITPPKAIVEAGPDGAAVSRVRVSLKTVFGFNEANDGATPLREAGIFNAATGGVMYNRVVFDDVIKTEAFKLTLLWDITF
jgi:hypothetical protein